MSPFSIASRTLLSSNNVEFGKTSIQAFPFISLFTRLSSKPAAIPLGCLSALVTWLNFILISSESHFPKAVPLNINTVDSTAETKSFNGILDMHKIQWAYCNKEKGGIVDALLLSKIMPNPKINNLKHHILN